MEQRWSPPRSSDVITMSPASVNWSTGLWWTPWVYHLCLEPIPLLVDPLLSRRPRRRRQQTTDLSPNPSREVSSLVSTRTLCSTSREYPFASGRSAIPISCRMSSQYLCPLHPYPLRLSLRRLLRLLSTSLSTASLLRQRVQPNPRRRKIRRRDRIRAKGRIRRRRTKRSREVSCGRLDLETYPYIPILLSMIMIPGYRISLWP